MNERRTTSVKQQSAVYEQINLNTMLVYTSKIQCISILISLSEITRVFQIFKTCYVTEETLSSFKRTSKTENVLNTEAL